MAASPLHQIEAIAAAAREVDGADPLDEATWIALRDGVADVVVRPEGFVTHTPGELSVVVHPDHRSRGVGGQLLASAIQAHTEPLTAWSHGNHPAAQVLADRLGWKRVRDLWVMRRSPESVGGCVEAVAPGAPVASGITLRSYRDSDAEEVVRVNAAAFADHPEQGSMDHANLRRRMAEDWWDPEGLIVADTGGGLGGFHWTKVHPDGTGEVYVVGVDPQAQGSGLGKALTAAGLRHLGKREMILYVESDNLPAIAVYSRLGFTHAAADTHVQYGSGAPGS